MSWGKLLQPDLILGNPILALTPEVLQRHQLQGLVLDVDETLVPMSMAEASEELCQWVNSIRSIASLWLVSNNLSEARIRRIGESLNIPYILGARKPSRRKLRQAVTAMNLPTERVAMVGDRLFTDVLAGNRLGMFTILVEPMVNPLKTGQRYLVRDVEVWFSQLLGVSIQELQQTMTHSDKS